MNCKIYDAFSLCFHVCLNANLLLALWIFFQYKDNFMGFTSYITYDALLGDTKFITYYALLVVLSMHLNVPNLDEYFSVNTGLMLWEYSIQYASTFHDRWLNARGHLLNS